MSRFLFVLLLISVAALANAAHITDKLVVGVYAEPNTEGKPLRLISSGTPLDVLKRQSGFVQVRLADDTQGWVESGYVTEDKPAKAMLLETQAKLRQMGLELAGLREKQGESAASAEAAGESAGSTAPPTAREAQLRQSLQKAEARIGQLEQQLADVPDGQAAKAQLDQLRARTGEALRLLADAQGVELDHSATAERGFMQRNQAWIAAVVALTLGFAAGVAFIDYRIRKRYGGFRI